MNLETIKNNVKILKRNIEDNEKIYLEIKKLKESKVVTSDFMYLVNETLSDLSISVELEIYNNDYIIKSKLLERDQLNIDDISEGEKNLISLLFFYFELFEDKNQSKPKNIIKMVILDDPISSMDDSNRFYVLEIVKDILKSPIKQVFVLTHVWDDYSHLIYGKKCFTENSIFSSYELQKDKKSFLIKNESKGNPYKHMFKEVYELSIKTSPSSDCDYYHMPNIIRKVFEEFLSFKTNGKLPQDSNKDFIEDIFKIKSRNDKVKLGTLLSVCNVLSHKNTKTDTDIIIAAKFLMKLIQNDDPIHYHNMKQ